MEKKKTSKRKAVIESQSDEEVKEVTKKKGKNKTASKNVEESPIADTKKKQIKQGTLDLFNIKIKPSETSDEFSKFPELPSEGQVTIYSWNINGLRATINKGAIENFIIKEDPDIFCFNETKIDIGALKKDKYDKIYSDRYASFWNCCKVKSGYSGVAIFTKYKPIKVTYGIEQEHHDGEGRVITAEFNNFFVVGVYTPNSGEGLKRLDYRVKEWDVAFRNYLNSLKEQKDVILCGDLNVAHNEIDVYEPKGREKQAGFTPQERESFGNLLHVGYIDTFRHLYPEEKRFSYFSARQVTHKKENKGWRLDYFVVNQSALPRLVNSEILCEYEGSDHVPIKLTWKTQPDKNNSD